MAQLIAISAASNDTDLIDRVFERLEEGNALENLDEFLTQLAADGKVGTVFLALGECRTMLAAEPSAASIYVGMQTSTALGGNSVIANIFTHSF